MATETEGFSTFLLVHSDSLEWVIYQLIPHPVKYHQVWHQELGNQPFYAWKPIPPSDEFVALGMIGTTSPEEPSVELVRCVPRQWVVPTKFEPRLVWNDSGAGGKKGSVWVINSMQLMAVTEGHDKPVGPFYEFFKPRFMATEALKLPLPPGLASSTLLSLIKPAGSSKSGTIVELDEEDEKSNSKAPAKTPAPTNQNRSSTATAPTVQANRSSTLAPQPIPTTNRSSVAAPNPQPAPPAAILDFFSAPASSVSAPSSLNLPAPPIPTTRPSSSSIGSKSPPPTLSAAQPIPPPRTAGAGTGIPPPIPALPSSSTAHPIAPPPPNRGTPTNAATKNMIDTSIFGPKVGSSAPPAGGKLVIPPPPPVGNAANRPKPTWPPPSRNDLL